MALSESIKDAAAEKYGEPPYGHAELSSLKTFTKKMGIDLKESMKLLKEAGFTVEGEMQTISVIGKLNNISPQQIYLTIKKIDEENQIDATDIYERIKAIVSS